jgi:hypothetical protein
MREMKVGASRPFLGGFLGEVPGRARPGKIPVSPSVSKHLIRRRRRGGVGFKGAAAMLPATQMPGVFGPYDGDFDPFEDDEDTVVMITFGSGRPRA